MRVTTLMYHDVVVEADIDGSGFVGPAAALYKVDVPRFQRHLAAIAATGIEPRAIDSVLSGIAPDQTVLLTFDDGGCSSHALIADLIEGHGWRGHFFITTDRIGSPGFMTASQIRDLHDRGHAVGSHSISHPLRMSACDKSMLVHEWSESVARLADITGAPVTAGSVPGGYSSRRVIGAAAEAGIRALFTSEPTTRVRREAGCLVIGRYAMRPWTHAALVADLASGKATPWLIAGAAWNARKLAKWVGGDLYIRMRRRVHR
jgi:peptidoglycan/xylan/chitin deacetylase (PgdA/CDA1 family)